MDSAIVVQEDRELVARAPEPRVAADMSNARRLRRLWLNQRRYESQAEFMCCSDEVREGFVDWLGFMFNSKGISSHASQWSRLLAIPFYLHSMAILSAGIEKQMLGLELLGMSEVFAHQMKIFTETWPKGRHGWQVRRFSWLLRRFRSGEEHDGVWCVHR